MTVIHHLRVHRSDENLAREGQLAWRIAEVAADPVEVEPEVVDMIINRVIDNAAVAAASLTRAPVSAARQQALDHAVSIGGDGATVFGCALDRRTSPEWAAWANGVAVRELDYHDTFLAADYSHPGDNIPPILAVAQHVGADGRGARARPRHRLRDPDRPRARDLPAQAQDRPRRPPRPLGRGRHRHAPRPRRRDDLPGRRPGAAHHHRHAPVAQGRDLDVEGARARLRRQDGRRGGRPRDARRDLAEPDLRGRGRRHRVDAGRSGCLVRGAAARCRARPSAASSTPTRRSTRPSTRRRRGSTSPAGSATRTPTLRDPANIESIVLHTSHHTHYVIGSGANDPQKYDPTASRETLDHSIPYIFAVALQDGGWHHVDSYAPERAARADTVELWHKVTTAEDAEWTRRYHSDDPNEKAFGGRVEITLADGERDRRRDRRRRRAPARRPAVRPRGLHPQVPARSPSRCCRRTRSSGSSTLAQRLPELTPEEVRPAHDRRRARRAGRRPARPKGLF